ncbi:hydrogenase maturation nickel metallochaperone HypA [Patescibacteria group bacterium]
MHELAITEHLLNHILQFAKQHKAKKVSNIHITLGELSGFIDESIEFYWKIIAKDTCAQHATITFDYIPGQTQCLKCNEIYYMKDQLHQCKKCNSYKLKIISGSELDIDSITIE